MYGKLITAFNKQRENLMYIQITNRCNMTCEHCCFDCKKIGIDMSNEVFMKALDITEGLYDSLTLGGGEPTLHPNFRNFLLDAINIDYCGDYPVFIITNGSVKKHALLIVKLVKGELLRAELSTDRYHDYSMVDEEVREAFESLECGTRDVSRNIRAKGRAKDFGWEKGCACNTWFIAPNGDLKPCGCLDSPVLLNIMDKETEEIIDFINYYEEKYELSYSGCYHDIDKELLTA